MLKKEDSSLESILDEQDLKDRLHSVFSAPEVIAWPTLALFCLVLCTHIIAFYISFFSISFIPFSSYFFLLCSFLIHVFVSFASFTVLHDCSHHAGFKNPFLNDFVGTCASFVFSPIVFYAGFKHIHNIHHKRTNCDDDPDLWSSHPEKFGIPRVLAWTTLIFYYYYYLCTLIFTRENVTRPWTLFTDPRKRYIPLTLAQMAVHAAVLAYAWTVPELFSVVVFSWFAPSLVSFMLLAIFFDYLPHSAASSTALENRFKTTSFIQLSKYIMPESMVAVFVQYLLFNQTYHVIHHAWPLVPFYHYRELWGLKKTYLLRDREIETLVLFELVDQVIDAIPVIAADMRERYRLLDVEKEKARVYQKIGDHIPENMKLVYNSLQPYVMLVVETIESADGFASKIDEKEN